MRLLYLVGGNDVIAGGATTRDAAFVKGLLDEGHDVRAVSLYGPVAVEGEDGFSRVFHSFGSGSLRRFFPRIAKVPAALASLVRRPRPAAGATSPGVSGRSVDARGPLAISLLSGTNKEQRQEFDRLVTFLGDFKPHAAVFANTMLSGLAEPVRERLACPVVCLTQGSDKTVEALGEPYRSEARKLIRKNARGFRRVIASSRYFAIRATESLSLPASRIKVVPPGVDARNLINPAPRRHVPFTIGYLAPIRKEKGLDILIDATENLIRDSGVEPELWISGPIEDERYWSRLHRRLEGPAFRARHKIWGSLGARERRDFMEGLSVFVVPSREPESRATHILEAMAAAVPVVAPSSGIIPEIFQFANGGLLVSSEAPAWMFSQALELLASMPETADGMGQCGSDGVLEHFSIESSTLGLIEVIENVLTEENNKTEQSVREKS